MNQYTVISGYRFCDLDHLDEKKIALVDFGRKAELRGTILLSAEGINVNLSGKNWNIESIKEFIRDHLQIPIEYKSFSSPRHPYRGWYVKIKKEIISMGIPEVRPQDWTAPQLESKELKEWFDQGKDFTILDTRNDYEITEGKFQNAIDLNVDTFKEFAVKAATMDQKYKDKPLVMYCTGGIRCEKASHYFVKKLGFSEVYQLKGGILQYFKDIGGSYYDGSCFVFDNRVAVSADAEQKETTQCYNCRRELNPEDFESKFFKAFQYCPHCYNQYHDR